MTQKIIHLLANAHIDPVWLWTREDGIAEAVSTCRAMVEMMKKYPKLTFIRGESWVYEQVLRYDPRLFQEIQSLVAAGRWDIVGGSYIQSDTNLPATATFLKQFESGKKFFKTHFHREVLAGWSADSFGQSRGLPDIMTASGLQYYAFGRPEAWLYPLKRPLFYWRGPGGGQLLCYRIPLDWYAIERDGLPKRIADHLRAMDDWGLEHAALFYGLGDHGGGTSERLIRDALAAMEQYNNDQVEIKFSTLHEYFAAAQAEIAVKGADFLETVDDEINFLQRGYYAAAAKLKYTFRRAETAVKRAGWSDSLQAMHPGHAAKGIDELWPKILFNSFHDILPGTSIEEAMTEQCDQLRGTAADAAFAEFNADMELVRQIDTTVASVPDDHPQAVPFCVFNPSPRTYYGQIELEAPLDYRPVWSFQNQPESVPLTFVDETGQSVPFQLLATRHLFMTELPWFKHIVFNAEIPAGGWRKFSLGLATPQSPAPAAVPAVAGSIDPYTIYGGRYQVKADPVNHQLIASADGKVLFDGSALCFVTSRDVWGSWGDLKEDPRACRIEDHAEVWKIQKTVILENGPLRASLFVRFAGKHSHLDATVSINGELNYIDLELRILWNERATRLALETGPARSVTYQVAGGCCRRTGDTGDVPGGRYLVWEGAGDHLAIASDSIYSYANMPKHFRANLIRGNLYAASYAIEANELPHRAAADQGEHRCRFRFSVDADHPLTLSETLELAPKVICCDRHPGALPGRGGMLEISPAEIELLDFTVTNGTAKLILQSHHRESVECTVKIGPVCHRVMLLPHAIQSLTVTLKH